MLIDCCEEYKVKVYLNSSDPEVWKKFQQITRDQRLLHKFTLVIEAVKQNIANKTQWNWESKCDLGNIYAIKVSQHRFYTLIFSREGYRNLFICKYGKKESQSNSKKLLATINSIHSVEPKILFKNE